MVADLPIHLVDPVMWNYCHDLLVVPSLAPWTQGMSASPVETARILSTALAVGLHDPLLVFKICPRSLLSANFAKVL